MQFGEVPMFQRNIPHSLSGSKTKPSKKPTQVGGKLNAQLKNALHYNTKTILFIATATRT
jgi:hypothetical protein